MEVTINASRVRAVPAVLASAFSRGTVQSATMRWLPAMIPIAGGLIVLALDAIIATRQWPIPVLGVFDDTAHLVTAVVLLAVVGWSPAGLRVVAWALLGSVLIDLDHVPLYTFAPQFAVGGRPPTHCLLTIAVLAAMGCAVRRWRAPLFGLALGVMLHFVRDVGTGGGTPLFFPWSDAGVRVPYSIYAGLLVLAAVAGVVRLVVRDRRSSTYATNGSG